jgi:SAM-dependent methyltransferase
VESAALLNLTGAESILDVGCGPGRFLCHLRRQGHAGWLVGLDQSVAMIAEARVAWSTRSVAIQGVVGDVLSLPFVDGQFAWVVARQMLYHVSDISSALVELKRVASFGILISTGAAGSTPFLEGLLRDALDTFGFPGQAPVMARFSTDNADRLLAAQGLKCSEVLIDNALIFKDPEPVVSYVMSCLPSFGITHESYIFSEMEQWVADRAKASLVQSGGTIRDPKQVGFYLVLKE